MEKLDANAEQDMDRVAKIFEGQVILMTGGTGFMGKVLLEKLLRSCPGIKHIYLIVRTKKGKDPMERLKDVFSSPVYDMVKRERGADVMERTVSAVAGDVAAPDLGLSAEDRAMLCRSVTIVYHCAATIRFDEPLKKAVMLNTRGTKLMLRLAKDMQRLQFFLYVSTAYCHLKEKVLEEKPYPPPADPHQIIRSVEWMEEDIVDSITDKILGDLPNTYAFTKALAEGLVNEAMGELPVAIVRPSIVIPIWIEPLPGWTDNLNGPTGLLIGAGKGVIRTMYCNQKSYADYLPVDIAANGVLVVTWDYLTNKSTNVYHMTSSNEFPVSWQELIELGRKVINERMPLNGVVWYPGGSMKKSRLMHNIAVVLFHLLPALLIDTLLFCLGYKPVLWRVQKRISKGFEVFEYYANNQWIFANGNILRLRTLLNKTETQNYKINGEGLDMEEYFYHCAHAARLYLLKETDDTIPSAKRHMKIMWCVDKIAKLLLTYLFLSLIYKHVLAPILA